MLQEARLYAITPDAEPAAVEALVAAVLRGGADVVQLRHKTVGRGALFRLACRLAEMVHRAGRLLIVNDHVDIALLAGADGVHLGDEDLPLAVARRLAPPGFLIGASANRVETARQAVEAGADYLGCGPAFPTAIKAGKAVVGPGRVAEVQAAVPVPVFAIGGVAASNVGELVAAGVNRACVIRGLAEAADPEAEARRLRELLCG